MSETLVRSTRALAARVLAEVAADQWHVLGFQKSGAPGPAADVCIDPEALLVGTFEAARHNPALDQALDWWAARGADLISLPRVDFVMRLGLDALAPDLARFAARMWGARTASGSWKRRAEQAGLGPTPPPHNLEGTTLPRVQAPAALLLRTRLFAGVGVKADLLGYLYARGAEPAGLAEMADALGYTRSVLHSVGDIARSGLATALPGPRLRYTIRPGILDLGAPAPWRPWPQIVASLVRTARWGETLRSPTPILLTVEAHELADVLTAWPGVFPLPAPFVVPDLSAFTGTDALEPFAETVEVVAAWVRAGLPGASLHGSNRGAP